jgi:PQQ-like domain
MFNSKPNSKPNSNYFPANGLLARLGQLTTTLCLGVTAIGMTIVITGCGNDRAAYDPSIAPSTSKSTVLTKAQSVRQLSDTAFEHSWDLQLPKRIRNAWISPELPDLIFFQVVDTFEIYAVDAYSGNTRWVTPAFEKPARLLPGASRAVSISQSGEQRVDDRIWVIADDTLFSFDAIYGQIVWRYQLPFSPSTSPMAVGPDSNQRIFIGDWTGRMQVVTYNTEKRFPYVNWQLDMREAVNAMPMHRDGLTYIGDHRGFMHCFKLDREEVWSFDTGAPIYGAALTRGRTLYVGNNNNTIYALNRMSGERLGALYMNGAIKRPLFAFAGEPTRIYAWVEAGGGLPSGLYAIKTQGDSIPFVDAAKHPLEVERMGVDWFVPGFDRLVGSTPENLFVTTGNSTVITALHRATGKAMWSWDTSELHKQYRDERGRLDPRETVFIVQYQDELDQNRSIYTADETGHVISFRVFGDKPGDPLAAGAQMVKRPAAKVETAPEKATKTENLAAEKPAEAQ